MANEYVNIKTSSLDKNVPTKETFETVFPSPNEKIITVSDWDTNTKLATIAVEGVLADEDKQLITVVPKFENREDYINAGIYCYRQAENQLSFKCEVIPTSDLYIYVILENVVYTSPTPPTPTIKIYGAEWTNNTESPVWTRTDDAVGFADPQPAVAGGTGSSPFDNIMPWSGMVRDSITNLGEFVAIPKFYYKITSYKKDGASEMTFKLQISDQQFDGSHVSPAHMDRGDGTGEKDVIYVGRYLSNLSDDGWFKSTTNVLPTTNLTYSETISDHIEINLEYLMDYATFVTIQMLYLVEFANWNSQAMIGYGCGNGSSVERTGSTDTMQYHTGTMQASRTTYGVGVQYRYIEDLWANVQCWLGGIYFINDSKYKLYVSLATSYDNFKNNDFVSDKFTYVNTNYSETTPYIVTNKLSQSVVTGFDWVLSPLTTINDETDNAYINKYICDSISLGGPSGTKMAMLSGGEFSATTENNAGQLYGLFSLNVNDLTSSSAYVGCRSIMIPIGSN